MLLLHIYDEIMCENEVCNIYFYCLALLVPKYSSLSNTFINFYLWSSDDQVKYDLVMKSKCNQHF